MKTRHVSEFKETEVGKIPKEWKFEPLGKYCTLFVPMRNKPKKFDGDIPWIRIEDLDGKYVSDSKSKKYVTPETVTEMNLRVLPVGTVLCSCTATIGICAITKEELVTNQQFIGIQPREIDNEFLYYLLLTQTRNLINNAHGTIGGYITRKRFEDFQIIIPSKSEQKFIVKTLSFLDSKIENLKNQNKLLKQIPQLIYKSLFVDFDAHIEFENSVLGQIPKGWRIEKLENILEITKGVSYKSNELKPSDKALVTLKSINRGGGYTERGLKSYDGKYKENQIVFQNDIIIAQTDLTQNAEVIGKPAIIRNSKDFDILIASLDLLIIRPKNKGFPKSFLYHMFMTNEFQKHVYGFTSGTTVLHLAKDGIPNYTFVLPPKEDLEKFDMLVSNMMQKEIENNFQIQLLMKIQSILLPKLMSGEIRV